MWMSLNLAENFLRANRINLFHDSNQRQVNDLSLPTDLPLLIQKEMPNRASDQLNVLSQEYIGMVL